jgi:hypothetical protein
MNPVMYIDPSGNFSIGSMMAVVAITGVLVAIPSELGIGPLSSKSYQRIMTYWKPKYDATAQYYFDTYIGFGEIFSRRYFNGACDASADALSNYLNEKIDSPCCKVKSAFEKSAIYHRVVKIECTDNQKFKHIWGYDVYKTGWWLRKLTASQITDEEPWPFNCIPY